MKINSNQLLEEENLAFIECATIGAAVVDDVKIGELLL
jgi:hypothetical protein